MTYTRKNIIQGMLIYGSGDTIAALILGEFSPGRLFGILFVGVVFYSLEIPNYFHWIDARSVNWDPAHAKIYRMLLAIAYFNPLWIARHLLFIRLFSGTISSVDLSILTVSLHSFAVNIPFSLAANYLIQNTVPLRWRYVSSASYSAVMAVYYAVSVRLFG
jgi:hypothetical protein